MNATPETDAAWATFLHSDFNSEDAEKLKILLKSLENQRNLLFEALKGIMEAPLDGGINTSDAITAAHSANNIAVMALRNTDHAQ